VALVCACSNEENEVGVSDLIESCDFALEFLECLLDFVVLIGINLPDVALVEAKFFDGDVHLFVGALVHCCACTKTDLLVYQKVLKVDVEVVTFAELVNQELIGNVLCVLTL